MPRHPPRACSQKPPEASSKPPDASPKHTLASNRKTLKHPLHRSSRAVPSSSSRLTGGIGAGSTLLLRVGIALALSLLVPLANSSSRTIILKNSDCFAGEGWDVGNNANNSDWAAVTSDFQPCLEPASGLAYRRYPPGFLDYLELQHHAFLRDPRSAVHAG